MLQTSNKAEYRYHVVRPSQAVSGQLSGMYEFIFQSAADELIDTENIFFDINLNATKTAGQPWVTGNTDNSVDNNNGLSQNPFGCLFTTAVLYINDTEAARTDSFGVLDTMSRLVYGEVDDEHNKGSPIIPYDFLPATIDAGYNATAAHAKSIIVTGAASVVNARNASVRERLSRCAPHLNLEVAAVGSATVKLTLSHSLAPLFRQIDPTSLPNSKLRVVLTYDSQALTKLPLIHTAETLASITSTHFNMNVPTYKNPIGVPMGLKLESHFIEAYTNSAATTASQQHSMPSGGVYVVMIAFQRITVAQNIDALQFDGPFAEAAPLLTSLYVSINGRTYPNPRYDFAADLQDDRRRAYNDYLTFTNERKSNLLTFSQWNQSPVFVMTVLSEPGNAQNVLTVNVEGTIKDGATHLTHVVALYQKRLSIDYNEFGQPSRTQVAVVY